MLPSPRDVVVGSSNLVESTAFLELFGFARVSGAPLPAKVARALYGIDGPLEEILLGVPGAERGHVRLVATPNPPTTFAPFDPRPFAIDLYSTDIEKSVAAAEEVGHHCSPITDHAFGPVVIREVEITGPDRLVMTLLQPNTGRMSSILDAEPDRLYSEVHAFVWSDSDLDPMLAFWEDCGLTKGTDAVLETPGLGALVGVPEEEVKLRLTVFADDEGRAVRVEYVDFLGKSGPARPSLPLTAGLHAPAFVVEDLQATLLGLPRLDLGEIVPVSTEVHPPGRAVTAVTPGGQRFEIWEES